MFNKCYVEHDCTRARATKVVKRIRVEARSSRMNLWRTMRARCVHELVPILINLYALLQRCFSDKVTRGRLLPRMRGSEVRASMVPRCSSEEGCFSGRRRGSSKFGNFSDQDSVHVIYTSQPSFESFYSTSRDIMQTPCTVSPEFFGWEH